MTISSQFREFFYALGARDKYSDFDSRKSFNRIYKPDVETSLLGASHTDESNTSFTRSVNSTGDQEGVHEVRLAWRHIKKWLHKHSEDINNSLSAACTNADINELEKDLSCQFPTCVKEFFRHTDGQSVFNDNGCCGLFYGLRLMPIDEIAVMTESWRQVHQSILQKKERIGLQQYALETGFTENDLSAQAGFKKRAGKPSLKHKVFPDQHSVPPNTIFQIYAHSQWIPLITDSAGSFIGIDLSPGTCESVEICEGKWGQVILFGRDFDTKFKVADTFGDFLLIFANDLEKGNWDLRSSSDNEDMISGVDTELVYIDHVTKKETPYLEILRKRALRKWMKSLSPEDLSLETNQRLIKKLQEKTPSMETPENSADKFLSENVSTLDAVAIDNMLSSTAEARGPKSDV